MPLQSLTPPRPAPQRTDDADAFVTKADNFVAWHSTFVGEMNTLTAQLMATTALIGVAPAYSDDGLRAMTGKVPVANTFVYFSGTASSALAALTPFARSLLDDVDAPAARATLGLGPFSQQGDAAQIGTNGIVGFLMDGAQTVHLGTGPIPSSGRLRIGAVGGYALSTFSTANYIAVQFAREISGVSSERGTITVTDLGVNYNTASDQTQKEDAGLLSAEEAWAVLRLIQIHNYPWKESGRADIGPFAQELFENYPNGVTPGGWFDAEGNPANVAVQGASYRSWSVDHSKLMPLVIAALQDLD